MQISANKVRHLVDKYFSLQWCRENIVVPISLEPTLPPNPQELTIAVGNIVFLGTIGNTIKTRLADTGIQCKFVELSQERIQEILDEAANER